MISIHATHTGGDADFATEKRCAAISIHATHTGGDLAGHCTSAELRNFNPRHPYGWRPGVMGLLIRFKPFQSTPPIRVATLVERRVINDPRDFNPRHPYGWRQAGQKRHRRLKKISIHATHTGGDRSQVERPLTMRNFNPRHPYGWRRRCQRLRSDSRNFNPRHPYGWRHDGAQIMEYAFIFQSTPPIRVATDSGGGRCPAR